MASTGNRDGKSGAGGPGFSRAAMAAAWLPIGMGGGVALGLVLDNLALGIAIGAAFGTALAALMGRRAQEEPEDRWGSGVRGWLLLALGIVLLLVGGAAYLILAVL